MAGRDGARQQRDINQRRASTGGRTGGRGSEQAPLSPWLAQGTSRQDTLPRPVHEETVRDCCCCCCVIGRRPVLSAPGAALDGCARVAASTTAGQAGSATGSSRPGDVWQSLHSATAWSALRRRLRRACHSRPDSHRRQEQPLLHCHHASHGTHSRQQAEALQAETHFRSRLAQLRPSTLEHPSASRSRNKHPPTPNDSRDSNQVLDPGPQMIPNPSSLS
ncbi:hypothetical protein SVAN01_08249 [Stagonosporopsis vannaccii]|nr:hypothetical protein SVAN01_08249 [Stagonosporopsis vannaccii]